MKRLIFLYGILITVTGFSQTITDTLANKIEITKDARLDLLVKKQFEINEKANKLKDNKGFRIMVLNTNNRSEVLSAKSTLLKNFPEQKHYLSYQSPYFRLKFGDFKTKEEALDYRKKLQFYFPNADLFIIPDKIEVKLNKDDKLNAPKPINSLDL
ncbi:MAG TPA: SPOR domain-containing protein [Chitinophagaceae bacterium]|nr:SPOR domain-containing protein [Chitinophagaceae bacterium]